MHKIKRRWWDRQWSRGCFGLSIQNSQKYITTSQISLLVQDIMKDITKARSWKAFNKCLLLEENVWLPVITLLVNIHNLRICHNFQNLPSIFCVKKTACFFFLVNLLFPIIYNTAFAIKLEISSVFWDTIYLDQEIWTYLEQLDVLSSSSSILGFMHL